MFTVKPPPNGVEAAGVLEAAPNVNPPPLAGAAGAAEAPKVNPPLEAGVVDAPPNTNGALAGLASSFTVDDAAPNAGAAVAPKLNPPLAGFGCSSFFSAEAPPKLNNGFVASPAGFVVSCAGAAPKVNGLAVSAAFGSSSFFDAAANEKAGAEADSCVFSFSGSAAFSTGFAPNVNSAGAAAAAGVAVPNVNGALAGFELSGALVSPPKENAGAGSGAFTGTLSGDLGGAPNVNVGALAGSLAVLASLEDAPKNASKPDSPADFFTSVVSAAFTGAVDPNENAGAETVAAGAVEPKVNPEAAVLGAGALFAAGIPNEKAGLSPAGADGANGDGAGGLLAAFSSSSIAACTFF